VAVVGVVPGNGTPITAGATGQGAAPVTRVVTRKLRPRECPPAHDRTSFRMIIMKDQLIRIF